MFTRCAAPNGKHAPINGVVCDNVTPSLAQVQYFLGMERYHAGIAANEKQKMVNCMKQKHQVWIHWSPKPRPLRFGHTLNACGIPKWLLSMAL